MEEPGAAGLSVSHAGRRRADREYDLAGTNTRRVRRALAQPSHPSLCATSGSPYPCRPRRRTRPPRSRSCGLFSRHRLSRPARSQGHLCLTARRSRCACRRPDARCGSPSFSLSTAHQPALVIKPEKSSFRRSEDDGAQLMSNSKIESVYLPSADDLFVAGAGCSSRRTPTPLNSHWRQIQGLQRRSLTGPGA
jgi:hypothetical protein